MDDRDSGSDEENESHSMAARQNFDARAAVNREQANGHGVHYMKPRPDADNYDHLKDPIDMRSDRKPYTEIDSLECNGKCLWYKYSTHHLRNKIKDLHSSLSYDPVIEHPEILIKKSKP
jgi:hypothetical protein